MSKRINRRYFIKKSVVLGASSVVGSIVMPEFFKGNAYTLKDFLKDIQVELIEKLIMIQTEAINPVLLSLFSDYENIYFLDGIFPNIHEFIGEILFWGYPLDWG